MNKYKVTREWIVEATDAETAIEKTKNWDNRRTHVERYKEDEKEKA